MRLVLFIALGLVLTMIWQAWQEDYGQIDSSPEVMQQIAPSAPDDLPDRDILKKQPQVVEITPIAEIAGEVDVADTLIRVKTDVLDIDISTRGGTIQKLALLLYPIDKSRPEQLVELLYSDIDNFYIVQGGLLSEQEAPNHHTDNFQAESHHYTLGDKDSLTVPLLWKGESGLEVIKTFTFYKGKYIADVQYQVTNVSTSDWTGRVYSQINRTAPRENGPKFIYTYTGAVVSSPENRYKKIDFGDIQDKKLSLTIANGWVAMLQHYFLTALLPSSIEEKYHYYTLNPDNRSYVIGAISQSQNIGVNQAHTFTHKLYFGPKIKKDLAVIAEGLDLTADYGIFWFIANPLFWVLDYIYTFTGNWGWSIVLVTLLLKVLFFHLSAAGYRSMANMRRVQPRLLAIRERYKDDKMKLNQAMMDLYKTEKINPLGGCFPILVQIPVFISLYWVLLESVEMRQADFALWIEDLSIPDPFFILPLFMGVTMFIQQKLNPVPMDPVQAKVMAILPFIFTVFFAFFPAGLVLYWVVNNILSILQQWAITRNIERATASGD